MNDDVDWSIIVCGSDHTLALKEDGTLRSCGRKLPEVTDLGASEEYYTVLTPTQVGTVSDCIKAAWVQVIY